MTNDLIVTNKEKDKLIFSLSFFFNFVRNINNVFTTSN